jgi:hypothetical protein
VQDAFGLQFVEDADELTVEGVGIDQYEELRQLLGQPPLLPG